VPFCDLFLGKKLYLRYWRCLVSLKNQNGQLITKLAQKLARIIKKQIKPTYSSLIPTMANNNCLEGNKGNMEETGGKTSRREPG
jgi:hypothetical protein